MGRPHFVLPSLLLLLILLLTTIPSSLSYPTMDSHYDSDSQSQEITPCIQLDAALSTKDQTLLFSKDQFFKLDANLTEIARDKTVLGSIDAALSFQGSTFYFKDTSNYQYSWLYGLQGPVENEKNWGEKLNGGVTAAVNLDDKSAIFFYHCRFYSYTHGKGLSGPFSLNKIDLPCEIDAAFMMRNDDEDDYVEKDENGKIAIVKSDKMWYVLSNGTVEGPVDVNSVIKLDNLAICSEDDLRGYGSHHYVTKRYARKSKDYWKKKYWQSYESESESEDEDESLDEEERRELRKLLEDWLVFRYGHGKENETSEEKVERELKLQLMKAWLRREIRDSESDESYESDSDEMFGNDSDESHEREKIREEIRMLRRLNYKLHVLRLKRSLSDSRNESKESETETNDDDGDHKSDKNGSKNKMDARDQVHGYYPVRNKEEEMFQRMPMKDMKAKGPALNDLIKKFADKGLSQRDYELDKYLRDGQNYMFGPATEAEVPSGDSSQREKEESSASDSFIDRMRFFMEKRDQSPESAEKMHPKEVSPELEEGDHRRKRHINWDSDSDSESESEEQRREQAKEMREQEMEEILEHLESLRDRKRHHLLKRDTSSSSKEVSSGRHRNRRDFQDMWMNFGRKGQTNGNKFGNEEFGNEIGNEEDKYLAMIPGME